MHKHKVIAIVGPTASGKSALGIALAKKLGGEVISADSRQVYRGMDIATGKVTRREMQGVPHHMLDIANPRRQFSAGEFVKRAGRYIQYIVYSGRVPIVVGGTGFYADALLGNIQLPEVPPNKKLRVQLGSRTAPQLYAQLRRLDPRRAKEIDPHNKVRLIRAIEIAAAIGKVPRLKQKQKYDILWLGIKIPNNKQKQLIHERLLRRIKQGMVGEAKKTYTHGLSYKRMEELGLEYRWLAYYLQNKTTRQEMLTGLERDINKYAKRQMRWFRRNKKIHWLKNNAEALRLAKKFLSS